MIVDELIGFAKRQYKNFSIFKAYSFGTLCKEAFLFPRDMLASSGRSSNVLNLAIFVTMRCNARCSMCNIHEILNKQGMLDMSMERIVYLLDDVKRYSPSIVLFGGEPFIRQDIVEIVRAVKRRGMSVGMFTNGTLITQELADKLNDARLDFIAFSLQGSREVHDGILAVTGAYDKMIVAIRSFIAKRPRHTKVIIHSTLCEHNIHDLGSIARMGRELDVDLVRFGHPTFFSSAEKAACDSMLKAAFPQAGGIKAMSYLYDISGKEDEYMAAIRDAKKEFGDTISFSPELSDDEAVSWYSPLFKSKRRCLFAWRGAFIYPNGDLYPCESISYKMGNIFEDGFDAVWNGDRYKEFRRALKKGLFPACARCCKL